MKIDINLIPFGKEVAISKESIMEICNMKNDDDFRKNLTKLRKEFIILSSSEKKGYWRPNNENEYINFIAEYNTRLEEIQDIIKIAKKEMREKKWK